MNILILDAYFYPEIIPFSYLERDILKALVEKGHEITVICPLPTRGIDNIVRAKYRKVKKESLFDGHVQVERFWTPREKRNVILRTFRYLLCNVQTYIKAKKLKDIDVVFAGSTPPTQGLLTGFVKKRIKAPFIYCLQDVFPDSLVSTGLTSEGSIIWKVGRKVENFTYKHADKIIVISDGFKKNIIAKGVPEEKIVVVPNWADTNGVYPVVRKDNSLIKKYGLDPSLFYISYCGNIGYTQNMDLLLDVAKDIRTELPNVRFVLIGDGAAKDDVEKRVKEESIDNVIILPFQPYEDIAHVFSLGDVGLIISKAGVGRNSVPSKTWSYMAAGRPILASFDEESELSKLIDSVGCGITTSACSKERFISAIKYFVEANSSNIGELGREYVKTELDKVRCIEMYIETMKTVVAAEERQ